MGEREYLTPFLVGAVIFGVTGFIFGLLVCRDVSFFPIAVLIALIILIGKREALSYVVIVSGFLIGFLAIYTFRSLLGIGLLGLSVMVGFLIGNNIVSKDKDYTRAEVRRSIALSVMAVFFALISFGNEIEDKGILGEILSNYWKIVMVVVGFYFGGRSAERIVEVVLTLRNKK